MKRFIRKVTNLTSGVPKIFVFEDGNYSIDFGDTLPEGSIFALEAQDFEGDSMVAVGQSESGSYVLNYVKPILDLLLTGSKNFAESSLLRVHDVSDGDVELVYEAPDDGFPLRYASSFNEYVALSVEDSNESFRIYHDNAVLPTIPGVIDGTSFGNAWRDDGYLAFTTLEWFGDASLLIYRLEDGVISHVTTASFSGIDDFWGVSWNGDYLAVGLDASGLGDPLVSLFKFENETLTKLADVVEPTRGSNGLTSDLVWHNNNLYAVHNGTDYSLSRYELSGDDLVRSGTQPAQPDHLNMMSIAIKDNILVVGGNDTTLNMYRIESDNSLTKLPTPDAPVGNIWRSQLAWKDNILAVGNTNFGGPHVEFYELDGETLTKLGYGVTTYELGALAWV